MSAPYVTIVWTIQQGISQPAQVAGEEVGREDRQPPVNKAPNQPMIVITMAAIPGSQPHHELRDDHEDAEPGPNGICGRACTKTLPEPPEASWAGYIRSSAGNEEVIQGD